MAFRQAERKQAKLRLALCGPSGSGKTYSGLLIGSGLAPDGRIALIDTERGSGELYADLAAYDVAPLEPPFTPQRYIALIREAEQAGYDVLILDSLSHAWSGDLWGSYSWIDGHIDEGDGVEWDLSHVSTHKVKLGTTLRYRDTWSITPKLLWIDEANNGRKDRGNPPDRLTTPGYTLVNLHIGRHKLFDTRSSLWLDVYNLFDKRYYAAGGASSRTFYDMPQQPRTVMLAFEHRF